MALPSTDLQQPNDGLKKESRRSRRARLARADGSRPVSSDEEGGGGGRASLARSSSYARRGLRKERSSDKLNNVSSHSASSASSDGGTSDDHSGAGSDNEDNNPTMEQHQRSRGRSGLARSSSYARRRTREKPKETLNTISTHNKDETDNKQEKQSGDVSREVITTAPVSSIEFLPEDNSSTDEMSAVTSPIAAGKKSTTLNENRRPSSKTVNNAEEVFANAVMAVRKKDEHDRKERAKSPGKYQQLQRERSVGRFNNRDKSPGKFRSSSRGAGPRANSRGRGRGRSPGKHSEHGSGEKTRSKSPTHQRSRSNGKYVSSSSRRRGRSPGKQHRSRSPHRSAGGGGRSRTASKSPGRNACKSPSRTKSPGRYSCARSKSPGRYRGVSPGKYKDQPRLAAEIVRRQRSKATAQVSLLLGDGPVSKSSRSGLNSSSHHRHGNNDLSMSEHNAPASRRVHRTNSSEGLDFGGNATIGRDGRAQSEHIPRQRGVLRTNSSEGLDTGSTHHHRASNTSSRRQPRRTKSAEFTLNSSDFNKSSSRFSQRRDSHDGISHVQSASTNRRSALKKEVSSSSFYSEKSTEDDQDRVLNDTNQRKQRQRPRSVEPNISSFEEKEFQNDSFDPFDENSFEADPFGGKKPKPSNKRLTRNTSGGSQQQRGGSRRTSGCGPKSRSSSDSSEHKQQLSLSASQPLVRKTSKKNKASSSAQAASRKPPARTRSGEQLGSKVDYFETLSNQNEQEFHFDI